MLNKRSNQLWCMDEKGLWSSETPTKNNWKEKEVVEETACRQKKTQGAPFYSPHGSPLQCGGVHCRLALRRTLAGWPVRGHQPDLRRDFPADAGPCGAKCLICKRKTPSRSDGVGKMVARDRIELPTRGFSIPCSTN